jgi:hypothetical protein
VDFVYQAVGSLGVAGVQCFITNASAVLLEKKRIHGELKYYEPHEYEKASAEGTLDCPPWWPRSVPYLSAKRHKSSLTDAQLLFVAVRLLAELNLHQIGLI